MRMTIQEAIKQLDGAKVLLLNRKDFVFNEAIIMAISALREKGYRECVLPLTYEDLLHMHGEPVYVTIPGKPHRSKWCIVDLMHPQPGLHGVEYFCDLSVATTNAVMIYRHKPKEVE